MFRTLLKSEVEAAITGKQWLLSCFGPFKESVVLPNFIEDRCFEEVRLGFLESSKTNQQQLHINELHSLYNDAMSKLNQLKVASPDTIQLVANIYNQSLQEPKTTAQPGSSVFGSTNAPTLAPQQQSNPFQMSSAFSSSQQPATAMNAGSIFGGTATSNPFQSSGSIFGGQKEQQPSASTFSFNLNQQQQPQSVFGSAAQAIPQSSVFGSPQPLQQPQGSSIFGGQSNSFTAGSSMFGAAQQQQPQQPNSIFGQSSIFAQPQQPQNPSSAGIFGSVQQPTPQDFPTSNQNIFGQFQAQQPPPMSQQPLLNQQTLMSNLVPQQPMISHQPMLQQQPIMSQQPLMSQAPVTSLFTQPVTAPPQNIFGVQQSQMSQQPTQAPSGSIFQIQQTQNVQQNLANPFQQQPVLVDESVYSKPENLTPDEILAFQAEVFDIRNIPLKPPPKHLCLI